MSVKRRHWAAAALALALLTVTGCDGSQGTKAEPKPAESTSAPSAARSVARVCAKPAAGPTKAPAGAVTVDPSVVGDLAAKTKSSPPKTTFWLRPGKHRLDPDRYAQVIPKKGNRYLGAPGAVLDGRKKNQYAFGGSASDVTIRYLTVQRFVAPHDEGVVNHDSADGWVIENATIQYNSAAGLMAGARQQVRASCLRDNGQYGMNAYKAGDSIRGLVVEGNEIVGNNTGDWERRREGCGCTGGIKFWAVNGADVRGNWVHDNRGTGLWADTNNNDFRIENNVIEANDGAALIYETSYNAVVRNNTIRRNNWVEGRKGPRAETTSRTRPSTCPSPAANHESEPVPTRSRSTGTCWRTTGPESPCGRTPTGSATARPTPRPVTARCWCGTRTAASSRRSPAPLYTDCRWKTQRVDIHDNRFVLDKSVVKCTAMCDRMAVLSNYGTYPEWSPYKGERVADAITRKQHNRWHDNVYVGSWKFVAHDPGGVLSFDEWQGRPYQQDTGSTLGPRAGG